MASRQSRTVFSSAVNRLGVPESEERNLALAKKAACCFLVLVFYKTVSIPKCIVTKFLKHFKTPVNIRQRLLSRGGD